MTLLFIAATPRIVGMRNRGSECPGVEVRDFVFGLAQNKKTTFGIMVEEFIKCTIEGNESNPHVVIANVSSGPRHITARITQPSIVSR